MTFSEFMRSAAIAKGRQSNWRIGQAYFNTLAQVRPDLADRIRGSDLDPFHDDKRVSDFLRHVADHWDESPDPIPHPFPENRSQA